MPTRPCLSQRPRLATQVMWTLRKCCTTTCLCDNSMRCKCIAKRTCSALVPIQMQRRTKDLPLQIGPCHLTSTPHWRTARSTSPLASNGKQISRTNSTLCKRVTRRAPRERPLRLAGPSWCTHRKIIGVQGPALVGRMAQQPLSATYATEEMTHADKRYPALAPRRMQLA